MFTLHLNFFLSNYRFLGRVITGSIQISCVDMGKDQPLRGKLAIVTGSSKPSGIGAATALALAEQGANVRVHFFDFGCCRARPVLRLP